nr:heme-binding domain-containing protein [Deinococcus xianganensis]
MHPARPPLLPRMLLGLIALFVVAQLVPYGRAHANPTVQARPKWDSPQTEALFTRACADCHSHATVWPSYSNVAPVSWLMQRHVDEDRSRFDVNVPGYGRDADEAAKEVGAGSMPPAPAPHRPPERSGEGAARGGPGGDLRWGTRGWRIRGPLSRTGPRRKVS